eukprot:7132237-Pyramimonas_sp.AAC.1
MEAEARLEHRLETALMERSQALSSAAADAVNSERAMMLQELGAHQRAAQEHHAAIQHQYAEELLDAEATVDAAARLGIYEVVEAQ